MARRRRGRTPDVRRLAEAMKAPGNDPRTWVTAGRIDDDPDAVHFDPGVGWIVDVTFYGSGLEDDTGRPCRVAGLGAPGQGRGEYIPPTPGAELLVVVPGGDVQAGTVAVGYLTNEDDGSPPTTVNGLPIEAELSVSTPLAVSPFDTEIVSSPHNRRADYGGSWVVQSEDVRLGSDAQTEPTMLGETTNANTGELLDALDSLAQGLIPLVGPLSPLSALGMALAAAVLELRPKLSNQLASRVRVR